MNFGVAVEVGGHNGTHNGTPSLSAQAADEEEGSEALLPALPNTFCC